MACPQVVLVFTLADSGEPSGHHTVRRLSAEYLALACDDSPASRAASQQRSKLPHGPLQRFPSGGSGGTVLILGPLDNALHLHGWQGVAGSGRRILLQVTFSVPAGRAQAAVAVLRASGLVRSPVAAVAP